ncbi:hypothetical protein D9758_005856 [Tetrapyrgos nigripes]|uniref:Uncharacterized protein n=1 Tax=Tetrapyrgos nigripes TaxID=182062 RepID=A0A8H5LHA2_9AGAR|nr:hypothetical protein D9758_005856 [Tetrapyrgos nigripes]
MFVAIGGPSPAIFHTHTGGPPETTTLPATRTPTDPISPIARRRAPRIYQIHFIASSQLTTLHFHLFDVSSLAISGAGDLLLGDVCIDFIDRSRCSLVFLRFEVPSFPSEKMRRLFLLCNSLKELRIMAPIDSKETLDCLTVGPVDAPVCLLPALEIIDLRSRQPRKLQCITEFFKMAHSRTSLERTRDPRVSRMK